ncbi:hypothetical protein [Bacillus paralicheniformis]|uniref:hypothetical protein n=1 Tax=Bacillus paralicheniformis TaxID=1648923 RepID=UPI0011780DD9|nr:hypothetical protein [Bacillus paralicheniformis]
MNQEEIKQLLILDMKRVIEIFESKTDIKVIKEVDGRSELDRETCELNVKLREIRENNCIESLLKRKGE